MQGTWPFLASCPFALYWVRKQQTTDARPPRVCTAALGMALGGLRTHSRSVIDRPEIAASIARNPTLASMYKAVPDNVACKSNNFNYLQI